MGFLQISPSPEYEAEEKEAVRYGDDLFSRVSGAIKKTRAYFEDGQHPDGYWWFELQSNVTITAEYLMLLHFAGLKDQERDRKMARHLLKHQRPDGTWAIHHAGKSDLSTTVEAYFALKLAGLPGDDPRMEKARAFIKGRGGVGACRFFTKIFLALFGQYDWKAVPSVPVEIVLLPHWFPVNIYNFSSWARATLVPLSIVLDRKPVRAIPADRGVRELYGRPGAWRNHRCGTGQVLSWKRLFATLDVVVKATEDNSLRPFRRKGLETARQWVLTRQEQTGDWAGIQPAMVNSVLALLALGHDLDYPPISKGLEALQRFTIEREDELLLQSCISPVWDTALTALSLLAGGAGPHDGAIRKSCEWLAARQILEKGDWSVKRPGLKPGGWAFEFNNNWYPDVDDTAVVLMLLNAAGKGCLKQEGLERGIEWIMGMQGKDGGWGAFDVNNNMEMFNQALFGDLEAMVDPSTPDITGRVLELLGQVNWPRDGKEVKAAVAFLKKTQEKDGLWWGRWGVNYIYGTWSVLVGLRSIDEEMTEPYVRKAVQALKRGQHPDGGWGECCESYHDGRLRLRGKSTPSQTAWALMALIASGEGFGREALRGVSFLLGNQKENGTWDEQEFTATGFPKHFMINYHNYRNCFPLMALGKFLAQFKRDGR